MHSLEYREKYIKHHLAMKTILSVKRPRCTTRWILMLVLTFMFGLTGVNGTYPVDPPSPPQLLSNGDDPKESVEMYIHNSEVMIFAKSYCPYCKRTRRLFDQIMRENANLDVIVNIVDLDSMEGQDGPLIQKALFELTGQRTVPNVFVGGKHVGGNDDMHALHHSGKLLAALEEIASTREL